MVNIKQLSNGRWKWSLPIGVCATSGEEDTLASAKIELAIAEANIMEHPYSASIIGMLRSNPEYFAKDWTDPPYT